MLILIGINILAMVLDLMWMEGFLYQMVDVLTDVFADMCSLVHIDNKKKDVLILGKDPIQGFDAATLTAGKEHTINFTEQHKLCLTAL